MRTCLIQIGMTSKHWQKKHVSQNFQFKQHLISNVLNSHCFLYKNTDSCPFGTLDNIGTQTCEPCSPGFYQNQSDQLFCYPCPAGYYQNLRGSTFCYPCEFGFYQNETKSELCLQCPKGKTTFVSNATDISQCLGESFQLILTLCFRKSRDITMFTVFVYFQIHAKMEHTKIYQFSPVHHVEKDFTKVLLINSPVHHVNWGFIKMKQENTSATSVHSAKQHTG